MLTVGRSNRHLVQCALQHHGFSPLQHIGYRAQIQYETDVTNSDDSK